MPGSDAAPEAPLLCHRCGHILKPGGADAGGFFVVRIEAFADPTPPDMNSIESLADIEREIDELIDELAEHSEREMMDEVHRRLTITLCRRCFRGWIENPAG